MDELKEVKETVEETVKHLSESEIGEKAKSVFEQLKDKPEELLNAIKNSDLLRKILGDDGKLSKDDLDRIAAYLKEKLEVSADAMGEKGEELLRRAQADAPAAKMQAESLAERAKNAVLGDDGKFDKEDVSRIAGNVTDGVKDLADKAKTAVLGEDGKFDKEDVDRIADSVKEQAKDAVDKIKGLFNND